MKIFISHKNEDSPTAAGIASYLRSSNINVYVDLMDNIGNNNAKALTEHIKSRMNECTDLLVVLSRKTEESWWVPFEIGMAAQKDYPMISFIKEIVKPPEYLSYYPSLKSYFELQKYIDSIRDRLIEKDKVEKLYGSLNESTNFSKRASITETFYKNLKAKL